MANVALTVEIAAPPELVGAFFIPQRIPYWYGVELESTMEVQRGAAEFRPGLKVRIRGRLAKRVVSLTGVVTAYERGRVLEWQVQDSYGVRGLQRWEIEPAGTGTRVRMRDEYELPGRVGKLVDRLFTRHAVAGRDRRDLERLKRLAERSSG
jgi:uncharacterized protein YndB with AHSA1/START domain